MYFQKKIGYMYFSKKIIHKVHKIHRLFHNYGTDQAVEGQQEIFIQTYYILHCYTQ